MLVRYIHTHTITLVLYLIFALLLHSHLVYSQYKLDIWTTSEGLPQNSVNTIIQTRDGYLWLGTYGGLVRFDGLSFTQVSGSPQGLLFNRILSLCESHDGGIWIGTEGGGLSHYTNGSFINYGKEQGINDEVVYTVCEDLNGTLWFGTGTGIQCVRNGKIQSHPFGDRILNIPTRSIRCTKSGVIWINSDHDVYRIVNDTLKVFMTLNNKTKLVPAFLYEDIDGSLWFRGPNGLMHSINGKMKLVSGLAELSNSLITTMMRDSSGIYWVGTLFKGLSHSHIRPDKKFILFQFPDVKKDSKIQTCFLDQEGNRWIGTDGDGLLRIKDRLIDDIGTKDGLKHQIIEAVFEDSKRNLWVGTNDGGLYRMSQGSLHNFIVKDEFPIQSVWSITEDAKGAIWAGSYGGGLFRYKNHKFKNFKTEQGLTHNIVLALYRDRNGAIWIGTENGGVNIYKDGKFRYLKKEDGLLNQSVRTFLQDHTGTMWIGTIGGLNRYQDGKISAYTTKEGLSHDYIRSIYEDADGILWIGTYGGGLNRLKNGVFTQYTMKQGLFDNVVSAIVEDENKNLWMSCNRGIFRVNRGELNAYADGEITSINSIAYSTADGMLSDETNGGFQPAAWKMHSGDLLFPTIKGVAVIHPERMKINTKAPTVIIEKLLADQVEIPLASRITIPYDREQKELHYTALSFSDPQHITIKYKFEGMSDQWINVKNRRSLYFWTPPPGEYTLRIVAANSNGIWNNTGASLVIVVEPPFWRTWYFIVSIICILLLLGYLIFLQRERRRRQEVILQHKFAQRLLDLMEVERKRIASELHDSIGQELLIIKNRVILALCDLKKKKNIKDQLGEISETASRAIEETREISYNLRPYQIDRLGLHKAIISMISRAAQTTAIAFTTDIDPIDNVVPKEMEIHVYRVIQECINNIIKHANATTAKVSIKRWSERLIIDVKDNGKGFDIEDQRIKETQGFGLHGMIERTRLLGGYVKTESVPGKGTRILITIKTNER